MSRRTGNNYSGPRWTFSTPRERTSPTGFWQPDEPTPHRWTVDHGMTLCAACGVSPDTLEAFEREADPCPQEPWTWTPQQEPKP